MIVVTKYIILIIITIEMILLRNSRFSDNENRNVNINDSENNNIITNNVMNSSIG